MIIHGIGLGLLVQTCESFQSINLDTFEKCSYVSDQGTFVVNYRIRRYLRILSHVKRNNIYLLSVKQNRKHKIEKEILDNYKLIKYRYIK